MNTTRTTEGRIWAVLSHLSALAFGMGILLPVLGWADQRRKSNYASFQCLQALGYQSIGFTVWVLSYLVIIILASITLLAILSPAGASNQRANAAVSPWVTLFVIFVFASFVIYLLLPLVAAIACALGRDFRYPILGDRLARYLKYEPAQDPEAQTWLEEDQEFRWVAAMGHFSILIVLWGMLAPLTAWILQGRNSFFLRFQSIQTLVYQTTVTVIFFIGLFFYGFGIFLLVLSLGILGAPDFNSSAGIFRMVILGITLLVSILLILAVPLLHILGQWAGYRVLKGENYRYPWIGRFVEARISNPLQEK